ncbi:hypothetical protein THAOC_33643, partial [Thalassiosira oceanica]
MDADGDDHWDIGPGNEFIKAEMQRLLRLQQFILSPKISLSRLNERLCAAAEAIRLGTAAAAAAAIWRRRRFHRSYRSAQRHRCQVGFKWTLRLAGSPKSPVTWETRFVELVQHKAKHGDCDVPMKDGKLGSGVDNQEQATGLNAGAKRPGKGRDGLAVPGGDDRPVPDSAALAEGRAGPLRPVPLDP